MMETHIKVTCSCGQPAELRRDRRFYNNRPAWYCSTFPEHFAYVGAHQHTLQPMGTLADPATHGARFKLHQVFDPIWQSGYMKRTDAYHLLAKLTGTRYSVTHVGNMDKETAENATRLVEEWLEENPI